MDLDTELFEIEIELDGDETIRIYVNERAKMSRGKYAAQAVHAALMAYGIPHGRVVVLGGTQNEIEAMPIVVRDAGQTEIAAGTLTAGCRLERDDES